MTTHALSLSFVGVLALSAGAARAELLPYYVGVDGLTTLASGTYAGLPNPNANRLTLLLSHTYANPASNHYHSKGIHVYTGPNTGATTAVTTSASNFVPESGPPIALDFGSGLYAGKLASGTVAGSSVTTGNTRSLDGFAAGVGETVLFNSSAGRWNDAFDAADVHWELISLTPGLNVGSATDTSIAAVAGDEIHLGEGSENFVFDPIFWTEPTAAAGTYEAAFRLVDESGTFGNSGTLRVLTQVVPEPTVIGLAGLAVGGLLGRKRRA